MTSDPKSRSLIPEGEIPCVWMTAGLLGYRLCDRELDCANCPLDRALRNLPEPGADRPERTSGPVAGGVAVPDDLFFHPGHTWVRVRPGGELEVGLDDLARRLLAPVLGVRLPGRGEPLAADRPAFTVRTRGGETPVAAPFEGVVTRVNARLEREPGLVSRAPFADGWILRAIPENPARALAGLVEGREAERWAEAESMLVRDLLDVAMADREAGPVGATLPDGGALADSLLTGVAPEAAKRILARVLGSGTGRSPRGPGRGR